MLNDMKHKQQNPCCGNRYTSHNPGFQQPRDNLQRKTVRDTHTHRQSQKETDRQTDRQTAFGWEKHPERAPLAVFLFQEAVAPLLQFWDKAPPASSCTPSGTSMSSAFTHCSASWPPHPAPPTALVQAWAPRPHIPQWPLTGPPSPSAPCPFTSTFNKQPCWDFKEKSASDTAPSPYTASGLIHKVHFLD